MKADIEWSITATNSVINRWRGSKNCPQITQDDVYQILFGYLRKRVITNKNQFKELKRRIYVTITKEGYISHVNIAVSDIERNTYNTLTDNQMLTIERNLKDIDYGSLVPADERVDATSPLNISFESIKSVKF
jgi:hypothetical protein